MSKLIFDISLSLDGYVAGPHPSNEEPLGGGGELLHEWAFNTSHFRAAHGMEGGEDNVDSRLVEEVRGRVGAEVMGRKMYSGGSGSWDDDDNPRGWWGDNPPFHYPVFVLTHHARDPLPMEGGTTFVFVSDGIESAAKQARAAAGDRDVAVSGGAEVIQQYLRAGLVDEMHLHVVPVFLGSGRRLFDGHVADAPAGLERTRVVESPSGVVHLSYRAAR